MIYTPDTWPTDWPNFSWNEMKCSHTGICDLGEDMMCSLQDLRDTYGKPLKVTSGYRHPTHPVETRKALPGSHTTGKAVDLAVSRREAHEVLRLALWGGWTGIGIKQHGEGRFLHLDILEPGEVGHITRPALWSYS